MPVLWVGCLMFLGWSAGACLLAWFTWRRHNWARYLLVGSAAAAALAGLFAFPFSLPHLVACGATIGFCSRPGRGPGSPSPPAATGRRRDHRPVRHRPAAGATAASYGQPPAPPPPAGPPPDRQGKPPVW